MPVLFLLFAAMAMAAGGIFWYIRAEDNDMKRILEGVSSQTADLVKISASLRTISSGSEQLAADQVALRAELTQLAKSQSTDIDILKQRIKDLEEKPKAKGPVLIQAAKPIPITIVKKAEAKAKPRRAKKQ